MQVDQAIVRERQSIANNDLVNAAQEGDIEQMTAAMARGATDFNRAMGRAARRGHNACVLLLRDWGARMFQDAFWVAASGGHIDTMEMIRSWDKFQFHPRHSDTIATALDELARNGHLEGLITVASWHPSALRSNREKVLIAAAEGKQREVAAWLFTQGADCKWALEELRGSRISRRRDPSAVLVRWDGWQRRTKHHAILLDAAIALRPLELPVYQLLWLLEWAAPGPLPELARVRLLEWVATTRGAQ